MTAADVAPASAAMLASNWGDRRLWFDFVVGSPLCRPVVAEVDGEIVGTGVTSIHGTVGWIGTIWVAPTWRRMGIGTVLTEATIDSGLQAGCRTLVLVATEAGRPLYERLGFEVETWYVTVEADGVPTAPEMDERAVSVPMSSRPFRSSDLAAMAALDRTATGEDRTHLLAGFAAQASAMVLDAPDGGLAGFVVRAPWGGGATIAPKPADAMTILDARRRAAGPGKRVRAGVLLENAEGATLLEANGWTEAWRAPRLVRGAALDWQPDHIWGQFSHALG